MKGTVDVRQIPPTAISDSGRIRIGSLSPAFPSALATSDAGKIRMGSMSPALPPVHGPAGTSDAGKVRMGSLSPAFPTVRTR